MGARYLARMIFQDRITRHPIPLDPQRGNAAVKMLDLPSGPAAALIAGAAGCSPYLAGLITQEADWLKDRLRRPLVAAKALAAGETGDFDGLSSAALSPALRRAKRRIALLVGLADLGGVWPLEQVTKALTCFADRAVDLALRAHVRAEITRGRLPPTTADAGGIMAIAMGKMGAEELNYSSDIDLIILYDDSAFSAGDQHEARAALIRATRGAITTLRDHTADGYVFRTDLRLRPDAAVTPVCMSAGAALAYYEAEGRTWERAAFIKARPCGGNIAAGAAFLRDLRPFIWRRHLDFATIQDTQDMRLRIRRHKGLQGRFVLAGHDLKLGQGGIREIEFFAQTKQLISGGRDPDLHVRDTVTALARLADKGWVKPSVAQELIAHYREHREVEHRLQMVHDAQTHAIPQLPRDMDRIAMFMGQADARAWADRLTARLMRVKQLTDDFFVPTDITPRPEISPEAQAIIALWPGYPALRSQRAQQIFARIEGELLVRMMRAPDSLQALTHFDSFLKGLPAGVQIFSLFDANPQLIDLIVDICGTAPGLADHLSHHPEVLDAVLDGSFFDTWPGRAGLSNDLASRLGQVLAASDGGYERALDLARRWTHDWQFRTGVSHLRGLISADEAGQQYADIADSLLTALLPVTAQQFAQRHGPPPGRGAVLVAMGSLGARLLSSASDLDLIMIYDGDGADASKGPRPLPLRVYYSRLTQAMITAISALTAAGRAYDVDMRLRPSGRQGPLATSLQAFRDYQLADAWTWEHLALTRARPVASCGSAGPDLVRDFDALRLEVLAAASTAPTLFPDLSQMRERIFLAKGVDAEWGAKIGRGRLSDIELFAQGCALTAAAPARGVIAQLRAGQRVGLISSQDTGQLATGFRFLWKLQCGGRLLSTGAIDLDKIGQSGRVFLLRETGVDDFAQLAQRLADHVDQAGKIIERILSAKTANPAARSPD